MDRVLESILHSTSENLERLADILLRYAEDIRNSVQNQRQMELAKHVLHTLPIANWANNHEPDRNIAEFDDEYGDEDEVECGFGEAMADEPLTEDIDDEYEADLISISSISSMSSIHSISSSSVSEPELKNKLNSDYFTDSDF